MLNSLLPADGAELHLKFNHLWNGQPLSLSGADYQTKPGETIQPTRLAYLLSRPSLKSKVRGPIQSNSWFGFVEASKDNQTVTLSGLPEGEYFQLTFQLGLDAKTNQSDPNQYPAKHALNPLVNRLHWTPQGGYIFFALEGHAGESGAFAYHLGNDGNDVQITIPFPTGIKLSNSLTLSIDLHLDRVFNYGPGLDSRVHNSTHSRKGDPLVVQLKEALATAFELRHITIGSPPGLTSKSREAKPLVGTPYRFRLKKGFPIPNLPSDYPLTNERVELGRQLFHETLLSRTEQISCSSCHLSKLAFTDGKAVSLGVEGRSGTRNSMPLFNLAWKSEFLWDGRSPSLREQALEPIQDHLEMDDSLENVVAKLKKSESYPAAFNKAFGDDGIDSERIGVAIEQFLLTLTSFDSRFDRAFKGKAELTGQEKRGFELFMTEYDPRRNLHGADCFHCHGGAFFSDFQFHNNGLKPLNGDLGREKVTGKESDRFKFSTPSLRNVAETAPYMHDGRFSNLHEVVEHYSTGIHRTASLDPNLGKHGGNGIPLSQDDKNALVAFLKTLSVPAE